MSRRQSFAAQIKTGPTRSITAETFDDKVKFAGDVQQATEWVTAPFESKIFKPTDMRQLALVAHNHMKPAMKEFITTYSEVLKKFRITGTQTTMKMCKALWGEDDPNIHYGLTCTSGPLGGDAQIASLMCMEDLGALIFFVDPLSAHPHQADIDSLLRLANCGNVIVCPNPTSAMSMMHTLKCALEKGSRGMIPSFFETLESPAVEEYKNQQAIALQSAINSGSGAPTKSGTERDLSASEAQRVLGESIAGWNLGDEGDLDYESSTEGEETVMSTIGEDEDSPAVGEGGPRRRRDSSVQLIGLASDKKKKGLVKKMSKAVRKVMG